MRPVRTQAKMGKGGGKDAYSLDVHPDRLRDLNDGFVGRFRLADGAERAGVREEEVVVDA